MSVNEKMTAIADAIREKTGIKEALSLDGIAQAIPEVYNAGYENGEKTAPKKPYIDSSQMTSFQYFCYFGANLELLENLDTRNGRSFNNMIHGCYNLTSIPELDTSKGTNFNYMFYECGALESIPELDLGNGLSFYSMFEYCTSLKSIPKLNTSNGQYFSCMFIGCSNLTSISAIDLSNSVDHGSIFAGCKSLCNITFTGTIGKSLNMKDSPLTKESITSVVNALSNTVTGQTLTLKLTAVNNAFGSTTSAEWTALAGTKTNWTISLV